MSGPKDLDKLTANDLKQTIVNPQSEIDAKNEILKQISELTRICNKVNEFQPTTSSRDIEAVANIHASLKEKLGIGPQTALDIDTVNSGVSRNDSDAVTEKNTELEEGSEPDAIRELYEMVVKLLEEIVQSAHYINELKETSASRETELVLKENRQLNELVATLRCDISQRDRQIRELGEKLEDYAVTNDNLREQNIEGRDFAESLLAINRELNDIQRTTNHQVPDLDQTNEQLSVDQSPSASFIRVKEREKQLLRKTGTVWRQITAGINELAYCQNKCKAINLELQKSAEQISSLQRTIESLRSEIAEKDARIALMQDLNTSQSSQDANSGPGTSRSCAHDRTNRGYRDFTLPRFRSNAPNDRHRQLPIIVADGGGDVSQEDNQSVSSSDLIECLYCPRSYPINLIEKHLQECRASMNG
ncbi:uncharacterized protein LOC114527447 isoform X2 [Dendronephthya gigantea]|uniref:uncharacterized protein LOC114527447 isoform X2 n=1 Tax=Dendronephthya gigantea TaxID=151771 RepID=UPI00106BC37F|nr:uncharacterized protein LOC114527447 isoform X2 [Dendronephthya gigantea]